MNKYSELVALGLELVRTIRAKDYAAGERRAYALAQKLALEKSAEEAKAAIRKRGNT